MKLFIASDHAGFELKKYLISYLQESGIEITDKGPFEYVASDDYPDWISRAAQEVSDHPEDTRAIVIGMSGQGEAIVANKFKNVRAGVYYGPASSADETRQDIPKLLREHNNANVLSLGAKFLSPAEAEKALDVFIETEFSRDERHVRRIKKINDLENE